MNRKMIVSLLLTVNATVALNLAQNHFHCQSVPASMAEDGTQPPAPPPGGSATTLLADGTQPPAPPPGRS